MKNIFTYKNEIFSDNTHNREKLKEIEQRKTEMQLKEKNTHMTLHATSKGIIIYYHEDLEEAITALNINKAYYRQLWTFNKKKGAFTYVTDYETGKEAVL